MRLPEPYYTFRRWALRTLVPEAFWPEKVEVDGVAIRLRNTPYTFGTRWVLKKGEYEKPERELLREITRPGMHVLEMGSSIGIVAAVIAHQIGAEGRLVTVEASSDLTRYSRTWLESQGRVDVVTGYAFPVWEAPAGLSVEGFSGSACSLGGMVSFSLEESNVAAGGPGAHGEALRRTVTDAGAARVYDVGTLCREYDLRPELLVVDVEGSETVMLRQPPNLPAHVRYVLIELHPWMYPRGEADERAIGEVLEREGFRLRKRIETAWLFEREGAAA